MVEAPEKLLFTAWAISVEISRRATADRTPNDIPGRFSDQTDFSDRWPHRGSKTGPLYLQSDALTARPSRLKNLYHLFSFRCSSSSIGFLHNNFTVKRTSKVNSNCCKWSSKLCTTIWQVTCGWSLHLLFPMLPTQMTIVNNPLYCSS